MDSAQVRSRGARPVPRRVLPTLLLPRARRRAPDAAVDDEGEWFQVAGSERAEKDGAEYDFFAHRAQPAELPATLLAKRKKSEMRDKMAQGMANLEAAAGGRKTAGERERHAARREMQQAMREIKAWMDANPEKAGAASAKLDYVEKEYRAARRSAGAAKRAEAERARSAEPRPQPTSRVEVRVRRRTNSEGLAVIRHFQLYRKRADQKSGAKQGGKKQGGRRAHMDEN